MANSIFYLDNGASASSFCFSSRLRQRLPSFQILFYLFIEHFIEPLFSTNNSLLSFTGVPVITF